MRDGTPDRATKLILVENGFRRARAVKEEIIRVELVTPIEIESATVKLVAARALDDVDIAARAASLDRKSTRLNSSHRCISYAVFCLNKKTNNITKRKYS